MPCNKYQKKYPILKEGKSFVQIQNSVKKKLRKIVKPIKARL